MFGFFKTEKEESTMLEFISHPTDPSKIYPLIPVDTERYDRDMEKIKNILTTWMNSDANIENASNRDINDSLTMQFVQLNVKTAIHSDILASLITDTFASKAGTRFMDCILRINMHVSIDTIYTLTGKFIYTMVHSFGAHAPLPLEVDKGQWFDYVKDFPWIIYIPIIQEIYDTEEVLLSKTK